MALSLSDPLFASFAFYSTLDVAKMMAMSLYTGIKRFANNAFANPEDQGEKAVNLNNPDVERVRRNHLNDIESIIPFVLVGAFYVTTQPTPSTALWHFRIFTASRFAHTIAYQTGLQPWRFIVFLAGYGVTWSMAVQVLRASFSAL